jgi:regulator of sigma E protease
MAEILPVALYGALILGVLVFVHELGHFLVAKALGVRVISFSIGMGPRVVGFRRGGTDYRISLLPLGGFVRMAGDTPEAEETTGNPDEFLSQPWWGRALITAAGPVANLIFALLINMGIYMAGVEGLDVATAVAQVRPGSVAASIGIRAGDALVTFAGKPAATLSQLVAAEDEVSKERAPASAPLRVQREGTTVTLWVAHGDATRLDEGLDWATSTVVGKVLIGLPAYQAGLRDGDEIVAIDGRHVSTWTELSTLMRSKPDADRVLTVRRNGRTFDLPVHTTPDGVIGVSPPETLTFRQSFPPQEAVVLGTRHTLYVLGQIYAGLWSFVTDPVRLHTSVAGPIAIAQVARQQASGGVEQLITFASFISLALMAMNLLPIPILDGGHIFFALIEGARRKPLSLKTQHFFQRIGLVVLVSLVVFSFYNDLSRVTQRKRAEADISKRLRTTVPADTAATAPRP